MELVNNKQPDKRTLERSSSGGSIGRLERSNSNETDNALSSRGSRLARDRGLTSAEAAKLLEVYGLNEIPIIQKSLCRIFGEQFTGTMPFILEACVIIALAVQDWEDFGIIMALLIINAALGLREQLKARLELNKLIHSVVATMSVSRDNLDVALPITQLVPGDIILLLAGNMVPADVEWLEGSSFFFFSHDTCMTPEIR